MVFCPHWKHFVLGYGCALLLPLLRCVVVLWMSVVLMRGVCSYFIHMHQIRNAYYECVVASLAFVWILFFWTHACAFVYCPLVWLHKCHVQIFGCVGVSVAIHPSGGGGALHGKKRENPVSRCRTVSCVESMDGDQSQVPDEDLIELIRSYQRFVDATTIFSPSAAVKAQLEKLRDAERAFQFRHPRLRPLFLGKDYELQEVLSIPESHSHLSLLSETVDVDSIPMSSAGTSAESTPHKPVGRDSQKWQQQGDRKVEGKELFPRTGGRDVRAALVRSVKELCVLCVTVSGD